METNKSETDEAKKSKNESVILKLKSAQKLKDYAISENLDVPDEIIEKLNKSLKESKSIDESELDTAIRDLTSITYPTTIKTLQATEELKPNRFLWSLVILSLLLLCLAIVGYVKPTVHPELWQSLLNVSLGMLGALVYVFFNIIGVMKAHAFEPDAKFENVVRIVLGGILGWLFFFTFKEQTSDPKKFLFVLLPFLAGVSTRLVFGVLNQAIRAIEITLGMEDTSSKILRRPKGDKTSKKPR